MSSEPQTTKATRTGGRAATEGVIRGQYALSVGMPKEQAPEGWQWVPLSSVARLESGHTPSRKHPEYWGGEVPWIGIRDATSNHGQTIYGTEQKTNALGIANSSARVLPANTVCLSRTASVGYVVVMGVPMATSQDFINWVCSEAIDFRYLKYVLFAEHDSMLRFASGTTHQTIYFPEAKAFHVCLPSLAVQRSIADTLQTLDDRIALLRETNATLEAIAQALFKSWFVDFDPVHARARGEQPEGLPEPLAALFPDSFEESPLGLVPRGWRVGVLGDIVTIKGGKQLDKGSFDDHGANPVFGGAGVMGRTDLKNATGFVITVGRVGAYCGQFFWHLGDAWVNNNSSHIQPASTEQSVWIYQWLRAANIDHIKKGAAQPFVSNGDLAELKMVIPDDGVVNHFVEVASPIYGRMHSLQAQAQTLATLRDTLLPRLISGQLRLPEAGALAEEVQA